MLQTRFACLGGTQFIGEGFCCPGVENPAFKSVSVKVQNIICLIFFPFTLTNFTASLDTMPATSNVTYANNSSLYDVTAGAESQIG